MFTWKKLGNVFNPLETPFKSWMHEYAQAPSVIVYENHVRVFFSSRPKPDERGQYITRLGYIDLDRANLLRVIKVCSEPILPLGRLGTFDEFGTYPVSVLRDGSTLRAYYAGLTRGESVPFNAAIGLAVSSDHGESFSRIGSGPVLCHTPDEPFVLGSPKIRKYGETWYLWYCSGRKWVRHIPRPEPMYKIRMAHSRDGIEWTRQGSDIIESVLEPDECQAGADVFQHDNIYHMFFSYRNNLNFREAGRGYRVGYASSTDLLKWKRDDRRAGLHVSETGWDSQSVSYAHVFTIDGKIYMLYQGNEIGRNGFGLAEMVRYQDAA